MLQILDKSFKILEIRYKIILFYILIVTFLISALDIAGIGLILPLFSSLITDNYLDNKFFIFLSKFINFESKNAFLYFLTYSILFVFTIKNLLLIFLTWFKDKFILSLNDSLNLKYFNNYLKNDLLFHSSVSSAKLITNLDSEMRVFTRGILLSFTGIIFEFITMVLIFLLLAFTNFKIILLTIVILLSSMLIILIFTKKKLKYLGELRSRYVTERLKLKQQAFNSIRDVKINFLEEILSKNYFKILLRLRQIKIFSNIISLVPKVFLETLIIFLLCFFFLYSINQNIEIIEYLPLLSLYFLCALRFIPSLSKTINYINVIRISRPALDKLYTDMKGFKNINSFEDSSRSIKFQNTIDIKNLSFSFNSKENLILKNVNFSIKKNSITGIVGRTGSGKSSLLNLIIGFYKPDSGSINVDNVNISSLKNLREWYKLVGLVPQDVFIYDSSLLNNIILVHNKIKGYDERLLKQTIKNSELENYVKSLKHGINTNLGEMGSKISGGQKQRIGIARCLYKKKDIIILDEATNSLDKQTEGLLLNNLKNLSKEKTIIIVSHETNLIDFCDHVYKIEDSLVSKIK